MNYIKNINTEIKKINKHKDAKILVISGKKSFFKSGANKILKKALEYKQVKFYFKKYKEPNILELKKIINFRDKFKPEIIIAVGGGSVLDYAKISNVIWLKKDLTKNIKNSVQIVGNFCRLIAIPTTAGSGSEVTSTAVIYIKNIKYSVEGKYIRPNNFLLAPNLVKRANKKVLIASALDCTSQALESILSKKSNSKSLSFSLKSLKYIQLYLIKFLINPNNLKNINGMCIAANYAGKAIDISRTTAPHALSYHFTIHHKILHGHAVFLTLIKFLKFNYFLRNSSNSKFNLNNRYNLIFKNLKVKNINELEIFLNHVKKVSGLVYDFKRLKINLKKEIGKILNNINQKRLSNNPVQLNKRLIKKILLNDI